MPRNRWPSRPLEARFWEKVRKGPGCWEWIGSATAPGMHGRIWVSELKRRVIASRVSWEMHFGPIPPGMEVCHSCDNPPCVRPDHLFLGTHRANMVDASRKGRTGPQIADWSLCRQGHTLTDDNVRRSKTGRRRCLTCARAGSRERYAALTPEERRAQRARWPRGPVTPEQRLRQRDATRRYRAKALGVAAEKMDEVMG